ncbi:MAG: branched-chain amino acid ABC transporter permease [Candidatus Competibacteraceae bacterium]|nr:branched-chain amino acid ABC transporter permease [Candidatus Competibacteraceae bacterium]MCB1812365.1 branched-chain amino acid ABC transporter permease [Candidatus Competibacteraceae bacterium]
MEQFTVQLLNGLSIATILILVSLGLAVIFGMLGIINLAHGEFFMLGAYCVATATSLGVSVWWGILMAPLVVGCVGIIVQQTIIRRLYLRPLDTLLATWGLSIVIRQIVRLFYGSGQMMTGSIISGSTSIFGVNYPTYRLFIIAVTVLILAATFYLYFRSDFGMRIRMVIANRAMAGALGVNIEATDRWAFAIAAAMVGFAGAIMSPLIVINPEMGLEYLSRAFIVVIVGGIGHLYGVIAGGVAIGGSEAALSFFLRPVVAQVLVILFAVVLIRIRPQGLTGNRNS